LGELENVTASFWAINNENLNPEYLRLLEDITPVKPLTLDEETFSIISEAVSLCIKFSERKHEKLYDVLLKDSCNTLVALVASQYLKQSKSTDALSRFEMINKAFKTLLESNFITSKKPTEYAQTLNISTAYLNECVKNTTGHSVSYHIQQRIVLEAKRLLYHSDKSVKEIASELGYEDAAYFSRMFSKVTGMTALSFRNKNHD
jgi:AraC-like DNA-binding protein